MNMWPTQSNGQKEKVKEKSSHMEALMQGKGGGLPPFASLPLCMRVAPDIVLIKHTLVDKV